MFRKICSFLLVLLISFTSLPAAFASTLIDIEAYVPSYVTSNNTLTQVVGEEGGNWMGAFTQSIPIQVPQGRAEMTPELALTYNNQNRDNLSPFGYGWSLEIPSIQRMNYSGVDNLYEDYKFTSSMGGELVAETLVDDEHGTYLTEKEMGDFLLYEFDTSETWTVTDKSGTVYTFGSSSDSRQDNPSDSTQMFKWLLEEVRDTNDNFITYSYTKDEGQVYPESITYTGNGTTEGPFEIAFTLEDREDTLSSYMTAFRVQSNYRVGKITVTYDGDEVRTYELTYTAGANGSRSLLESITESAQNADGLETTLEPTTFTYSGSKEIEWIDDSDYESPIYLWEDGSPTRSLGKPLMDVNGDNIIDFVENYWLRGTGSSLQDQKAVYLGDGTDWDQDSTYDMPLYLHEKDLSAGDQGVRLRDVNGDFCPDFLLADERYTGHFENETYLSDCEGSWTQDSSYTIPVATIHKSSSGYPYKGLSIIDVNGDSLNDFVKSAYRSANPYDEVHINNGDGSWFEDTNYDIPRPIWNDYGHSNLGIVFADVNADGLVDLISSYDYNGKNGAIYPDEQVVYLNQGNGTGWSLETSFTVPMAFWRTALSDGDRGIRVVDVNADGFTDILWGDIGGSSGDRKEVYINNGDDTGWTLNTDLELPIYLHQSGSHHHAAVRIADINGDGMMDFLKSGYESTAAIYDEFYINSGEKPDLLETITSSKGATTSVSYQNTNQYKNADGSAANPYVPFNHFVVSEVTVEDGLGLESTITYDYEGGEYYYEDARERSFSGFSSITKTESDERKIITYYHQDEEPLFGRSYKIEIYDSNDNLYQSNFSEWAITDLGNDSNFVHLTDSIELHYDAQSSHRDKATSYEYDEDNGNLIQMTEWGEVNASSDGSFTDMSSDDDRITTTEYAKDSSGDDILRAYPSQITLSDSSGDILSDLRFTYDELSHGRVEFGDLSAESSWLDTDSSWLMTTYRTDSYGLIELVEDPSGSRTMLTYDSENLYPETITNELGHFTEYEYDYITGQLLRETDVNGYSAETSYDGFGRILSSQVPDPETGSITELFEVEYVDDEFPTHFISTVTVDSVSMESSEYYDGLGRVIQAWTPAESGVNLVDTWYDELGRVSTQTLAYENSSSSYSGRDTSQASSSFTYDPLDRPITETTPVGTLTRSYEHWEEVVTDPMGIDKTFTVDAYGQLIQVNEENDSNTHTTAYQYNAVGALTKLTDAQGNIRNFTYDTLGRITSQDDLHDPSVSVLAWEYTYDENGNILTQTSPNGGQIRWDYDPLNRVLIEDWNDDGSNEFTYTYDDSANGVGLLEKVQGEEFEFHYEYDAQGNIAKENKSIDGQSFSTVNTYDLMGRVSSILYPHESMEVDYIYNSAGQIESISRNGGESIVDNFDYSPVGQISLIEFANGVSTTNTYDADEAYRLTSKVTSNTDGNIQDLTYTYDNNGNITQIVDDAITSTNKTLTYTYDDLNRLTEASSSGFVDGDYSLTYDYDSIGNMTYKSDIGSISYEGLHPQAATDVNGQERHYDENGNYISNGEHEYVWNIKNQLIHGDPWTYTYDHTGQRIIGDNGRFKNLYVNQLTEVIEERRTDYIFAGSVRVASFREGESPEYYHQDHLGGTAVVTSESGDVSHTKDYYPYGSELLSEGDPHEGPNHTFTDKEFTDELGLYYFEARWMDPTIGRFTSLDPAQYDGRVFSIIADPQSFNAYSYSRNNPIVYVDPSGELQIHTDGASQEQVGQFYESLGQLIEDVSLNQELQNYYSDLYGVDIMDILINPDSGPDVYIYNTGYAAYGEYRGITNNIKIYDNAYEKDNIGVTLIHELEHWANDVASTWGDLDPDIGSTHPHVTDRLEEFRDWWPRWGSNMDGKHGYYGYASEVILCDKCAMK